MGVESRSSEIFRVLRLHLDDAANGQRFDIEGNFLRIREASAAALTIQISPNESNAYAPYRLGQGFRHLGFSKLWVTHEAVADGWVDIEIAGNPHEAKPELFETFQAGELADVNLASHDFDAETALPVEVLTLPTGATQTTPEILDAAEAPTRLAIHNEQNAETNAVVYTVPANKVLDVFTAVGCCISVNNTNVMLIDDGEDPLHEFAFRGGSGSPNRVDVYMRLHEGYRILHTSTGTDSTIAVQAALQNKPGYYDTPEPISLSGGGHSDANGGYEATEHDGFGVFTYEHVSDEDLTIEKTGTTWQVIDNGVVVYEVESDTDAPPTTGWTAREGYGAVPTFVKGPLGPANITVSGGGYSASNGEYVPQVDYEDGKWEYHYPIEPDWSFSIRRDGGKWEIYERAGGVVYEHTSDDDIPPSTGWTSTIGAFDPPPTLSSS